MDTNPTPDATRKVRILGALLVQGFQDNRMAAWLYVFANGSGGLPKVWASSLDDDRFDTKPIAIREWFYKEVVL